MRTVNPYYVFAIAGIIDDGAEFSYPAIITMNSDDELELRQMIRALVVKHYIKADAESQYIIKLSLAYYLRNNVQLLIDGLDSWLTEMPDANNKALFWQVLWSELFPNERAEDIDLSDCVESHDCNATDRIRWSK